MIETAKWDGSTQVMSPRPARPSVSLAWSRDEAPEEEDSPRSWRSVVLIAAALLWCANAVAAAILAAMIAAPH